MSTAGPLATPKLPGFGRVAFVGGSVLMHVGVALVMPSVLPSLSSPSTPPSVVEFTLSAPEPAPPVGQVVEPESVAVAAAAPIAARPTVPSARARPVRPRPPKAVPVAAPAPEPVTAPTPPPATPGITADTAVADSGGVAVVAPAAQVEPRAVEPRRVSAPATLVQPTDRGPIADVGKLKRSYLKSLTRVLHRHRRYPSLALRERLEGTVLVSITIDAAGHIRDVALRRSSGHALLDRSALAAVRATPSIPVPPAEMGWRTHSVTLPIAYVLQ